MDIAAHLDALIHRPAHWLQGAQLAVVVSIQDPDSRNRVQVRLVGCDDSDRQDAAMWARVVCPFAGKDRGAFFLPDVDDEVLVFFQNGDPASPLVIGGLWNGDSASPADTEGATNRYKRIRSKSGITLTMDDQSGQETFIAETPAGQRITLKDGPGKVLIEDANGNSVELSTSGITINASAQVKVQASQVNVSAGMVQVDSSVATFSGIVQCQTLIATSVVSSSYTPGAGNVW
jgi:uncharacterized protein involved in type VI secretion and phage assembly